MLTKQASLFQEAGELSIGLRVAVYFFAIKYHDFIMHTSRSLGAGCNLRRDRLGFFNTLFYTHAYDQSIKSFVF